MHVANRLQFVEEQAIDRVHRLNQTVDVVVYRLSIHNSVEQRIVALQEAKRALANQIIDGSGKAAQLSMDDVLRLFKPQAEFDLRHADADANVDRLAKTRVLDTPPRGPGPGSGSSSSPPAPADAGFASAIAGRGRARASSAKSRPDDGVFGRR